MDPMDGLVYSPKGKRKFGEYQRDLPSREDPHSMMSGALPTGSSLPKSPTPAPQPSEQDPSTYRPAYYKPVSLVASFFRSYLSTLPKLFNRNLPSEMIAVLRNNGPKRRFIEASPGSRLGMPGSFPMTPPVGMSARPTSLNLRGGRRSPVSKSQILPPTTGYIRSTLLGSTSLKQVAPPPPPPPPGPSEDQKSVKSKQQESPRRKTSPLRLKKRGISHQSKRAQAQPLRPVRSEQDRVYRRARLGQAHKLELCGIGYSDLKPAEMVILKRAPPIVTYLPHAKAADLEEPEIANSLLAAEYREWVASQCGGAGPVASPRASKPKPLRKGEKPAIKEAVDMDMSTLDDAPTRKTLRFAESKLHGQVQTLERHYYEDYAINRDPRKEEADGRHLPTPIRHPRSPKEEADDSILSIDIGAELSGPPVTPHKYEQLRDRSPEKPVEAKPSPSVEQIIQTFKGWNARLQDDNKELAVSASVKKKRDERHRLECERRKAEIAAAKEAERLRLLQEEARRKREEEAAAAAEKARLAAEAAALAAAARLITPISSEWNEKIKAHVAKGMGYQINGPGGELTARDFSTLLFEYQHQYGCGTNGWLNDEIVNSFFAAMVQRDWEKRGGWTKSSGKPAPVYAFASHWHTTATKSGIQAISRWSRRANYDKKRLLEADTIFFPICTNNHWTLLVVKPKAREIEYLDSFHGNGRHKIDLARSWLKMELGSDYVPSEWTEEWKRSSSQCNAYDCGIFTCFNGFAVIRDMEPSTAFEQSDASDARHFIAAVLINTQFGDDLDW